MQISKQIIIACLILASQAVQAERVSRHNETASGLQGWKVADAQIEVQLNPLTLDQVRAFYLGRSFSDQVTEIISQNCVFQTVIKNPSDSSNGQTISINLNDWRIIRDSEETPLKSKQAWIQQWSELGANPASQLAFRWATFPFSQDYHPGGDYGWGMILFGLPPGSSFDLLIKWQLDGKADQQLVSGLTCPAT